jgi:hypothetical protein
MGGGTHRAVTWHDNDDTVVVVVVFVYYVYYMISAFVLKGLRTMSTTCLDGPEIKLSQRDISRTSTPQPKIRTTGGVTAQTEKDTKIEKNNKIRKIIIIVNMKCPCQCP